MTIRQAIFLGASLMLTTVPAGVSADAPQAAPAAVRVEARDIFAHIVGIESSIGKGGVPEVAAYLARRFEQGGFPATEVHVLPLGETASLVVRYRGSNSTARPIVFFFGRGTSDVKQEVALLTTTFLRLRAEHFVPTRDLILAFSGDEVTAAAECSAKPPVSRGCFMCRVPKRARRNFC